MKNQDHKILIIEKINTVLTAWKLQTLLIIPCFSALVVLTGCPCDSCDEVFSSSISGSVYDALTMEPIQGALIELSQGAETIKVTSTDSDGRYVLTLEMVNQENFQLSASQEGYEERTINVMLNAGDQTKQIDFQLEPMDP